MSGLYFSAEVRGLRGPGVTSGEQAALRDRATHTGTQSADTLTEGSANKLYTSGEKAKVARAISTAPLRMPKSRSGWDFAVVLDGKVLFGTRPGQGRFVSNHSHEGLLVRIPRGPLGVQWGVVRGGKYLAWTDNDGIWHSDHSHADLEADVATLREDVDALQAAGGGNVAGWLAREVTVGGEQQVMVHDGADYRQITPAGADWIAPIVHSNDIVRALSDYTTGDGLQPHTILPNGEIIPEAAIVMQVLVTGQSLALGSRGYILDPDGDYLFDPPNGRGNLFTEAAPADLQPYLLTLNGGARALGSTLVPTREYADGLLGESVCSSYMIARARYVRAATNGMTPRLAAAISAAGASPYDWLKKGTSIYNGALAKTQAIFDAAAAQGWKHAVSSIRIIHGEAQGTAADPADATEVGYAAVLREWVSDYQADLKAITGQPADPVGLLCQMNTLTAPTAEIPLGQLKAHDDYADIVLIGPKYQHPYYDGSHMLAEGYVKTGELEARAMRFWHRGQKWQCLKPVSCAASGSVVTVTFNNAVAGDADTPGPIGPLMLDAATVSDPGHHGFACSDGGVTISGVAIGPDQKSVVITLSGAPAGGSFITYALQYGAGWFQPSNGPRGTLRDSDTRDLSRFDNEPVHNWAVAFKIAIS
ncbi:MAG: hypothetical protein QM605_13435 [Sphingobium sp.]